VYGSHAVKFASLILHQIDRHTSRSLLLPTWHLWGWRLLFTWATPSVWNL